MDPAARMATYEDLLALGEDVRAEVLSGEIVTLPSPSPRHSRAQRVLGRLIGGPYDDDHGHGGPGGWWILMEVDVRLTAHDVARPDLVGWRRERLASPWDERPIDVVPDWIAEIISPHNAARDRVHKRRLYAEHGVSHFWMVDPIERTLEALRLESGQWVEIGSWGDGDTARIDPFAEVELEVQRLFPPLESEPDVGA